MKKIITLFLFSIHFISFSQTDKKKVLVVLYDQVDFNTDYSLGEIAGVNLIQPSQVYDSLVGLLMSSLSRVESPHVTFSAMPEMESQFIKSVVTKNSVKKPARYSVSLDNITNNEFNYMLSKNEADYVLFVNFYQFIQTRVSDEEKRALDILVTTMVYRQAGGAATAMGAKKYANQLIDFEVYGVDKELVFVKGRYRIPIPGINEKNYLDEGKDFKTIATGYDRFSLWLSKELVADPN